MKEQMSDEFFEELSDELRAAYNPPPDTPRERLWLAVQARRAARPALTVVGGGERRRTVAWRRLAWALPIAATLIVGIAIGRFLPQSEAGGVPEESALTPGATPDAAPMAEAADVSAASEGGTDVAGPGAQAADVGPVTSPRIASAVRAADARTPAPTPGELAPQPGAEDEQGAGAIYRVAALETLGRAETLLSGVDTSARTGEAASLALWSEDMLSQARLLMDSPAAEDPAIRNLLEDLELVLAQLVRLGDGATSEGEIALIEGAVEQRQLLHRIRAVLPTGPITSGT
ncbi:MAG: hypothetical protein ABFS34_01125 [Gemmatimonadota bacterium]